VRKIDPDMPAFDVRTMRDLFPAACGQDAGYHRADRGCPRLNGPDPGDGRSLRPGIERVDPLVLGGIALPLLAVTVLAAWAPARRASLIDPLRSLRDE